jgi:predicted GIY-YIG superfamily endonuclease
MAYMYILRCSDGTYYVGSTRNLDARVHQHQTGEGARYTQHRLPVELVYSCFFERVVEAFAAEKKVQGWSRAKREALIAGRFDLLPRLSSRSAKKRENPDQLGG